MTTYTEPDDVPARLNRHQAYVRWIENTCRTDPGARTALRKGVRRGIDDSLHTRGMHRLISPWLPKGPDTSDTEQRAYYTVAALIAAQPRHSFAAQGDPGPEPEPDDRPASAGAEAEPAASAGQIPAGGVPVPPRSSRPASLGVAFAQAVAKSPGREREMRQSTAETRLNLLTRQSLDGLHRHLPATVMYLRDFDAPIDWARLMTDLIDWPARSGRISRRWLQDFYWLCAKADRDAAARSDAREAHDPDAQN